MIIQGDSLKKIKEIGDNSVDSLITDPPYELGFMGKSWDKTGIANNVELWSECLRVLKPGGHLLAFSGTRTYHRMASAIEDAGFEVRDMIEWVYGSGFPKSLNIGKVADKYLKTGNASWNGTGDSSNGALGYSKLQHQQGYRPKDYSNKHQNKNEITEDDAKKWEGWGTALKPSHEPVVFSSKPLTPKLYFAILIGDISNNIIQLCQISNVKNAEKIFSDFQVKLEKEGVLSVAENARMNAWESLENVRFAEQSSISSEQKSYDLIKTKESSAQSNVRQSGNEGKTQEIKTLAGVEENIKALMDIIIFGTTEDTSQNIALLWNSISEELLNQANTLTIKMATRLITDLKILKLSATQSILESTGNLFKTPQNIPPNHEPICMARKPLSEKNVAENVLKWGTGGINIDISRITPNDEVAQQNNPENAKGGIVVSDKHEFYPSSLADAFSYSLQQLQDFFQHIASVRTSYSISDITPLSSAKVVFHNQGSQLLGVPCDYDDLVKRVYECASAELSPQGSLNGYPILSRLCGEYAHPDVKGDREIFLLSTDVPSNIDRLSKELHTPSGHNNQFLVFVLVLFAYDLFNTLYHNDTTSKNKMQGRFPANLIHDNSEEVRECFPDSKSSPRTTCDRRTNSNHEYGFKTDVYSPHNDSGNSARFFKSIIYTAKASKSERNRGCEGLEEKQYSHDGREKEIENPYQRNKSVATNNHPTVKPVALMEYLIKMVTPKGGTVLDPFMGSGTTGVACKNLNRNFIGIELSEEYCEIAKARIENTILPEPKLL